MRLGFHAIIARQCDCHLTENETWVECQTVQLSDKFERKDPSLRVKGTIPLFVFEIISCPLVQQVEGVRSVR